MTTTNETATEATATTTETKPARRACCEACGRAFVYTPGAQGGRPRVYCDATCAKWANSVVTILSLLAEMRERMTAAMWLRTRQEFWGVLNARAWNRGVTKSTVAALLASVRG